MNDTAFHFCLGLLPRGLVQSKDPVALQYWPVLEPNGMVRIKNTQHMTKYADYCTCELPSMLLVTGR